MKYLWLVGVFMATYWYVFVGLAVVAVSAKLFFGNMNIQ